MAVSVENALQIINYYTKPVKYEIVPIENALGKVSYEDIFASHYMPRYNNSAMDGYGIELSSCGKKVKVIDTILAGDKKLPKIKNKQSVKIMTGARVPNNIEAIVPHELVEIVDEKTVKIPNDVKAFANIRFVGEDIKNGEVLLKNGENINFSKITLLASQGITHIKVYKKPKVTVFASGEELKLHYENVEEHQLYNSNTPTLLARVKELGCDVTFIGMAKDTIEGIKELIKNSLDSDLIITSGGVSVGDADFTKEAFEELGMEILFDGIVIKPGKPTILGKIGSTTILNLPGNPLACSLIFEYFGKIIVQKLSGSKNIFHNCIKTKISHQFNNKKGRVTLIPGYFDGDSFSASPKRSPGMINILSKCNSMIALDKEVEFLKENEEVKVLPIEWNFLTKEEKDILTYEVK
jgi:molybdopterin molybdotransferase